MGLLALLGAAAGVLVGAMSGRLAWWFSTDVALWFRIGTELLKLAQWLVVAAFATWLILVITLAVGHFKRRRSDRA